MLTQESVLNVLKNVKNVPVVQLMLVNVLILESTNHIVIAQPDIMKLVKNKPNVKLVTINVALVTVLLLTVMNVVVKKDITLLNVGALMDTMIMVSIKIVNHVLSNVKLVQELLITVMNVKKTEVQSQIVTVHSLVDIMKLKVKLIAHHVTQDVKPVQFIIHVKPVKLTLTDILHQNVHVWMVSLKSILNVSHVLINVLLVLDLLITAQLVPAKQPELTMITNVSV